MNTKLLLTMIDAKLSRLIRILEKQQSNGEVLSYSLDITDEFYELKFGEPCLSLSVVNVGTDNVHVWVNSSSKTPRTLRPNASLNIDFGTNVLYQLFLQCETDDSTTVEIVLKR